MKKPYRPTGSKSTSFNKNPRPYGKTRDASASDGERKPFKGNFSKRPEERGERAERPDGHKPKRAFSGSRDGGRDRTEGYSKPARTERTGLGRDNRRDDGFKPKRSFDAPRGRTSDGAKPNRRDDRRDEGFKPKRSFDAPRGRTNDNTKPHRRDDRREDGFKPKRSFDAPRGRTRDGARPKRDFVTSRPSKVAPRFERATELTVDSNNVLIWGLHAARAAWLNPKRRCHRLWLTEAGQAAFAATLAEAQENLLKRPDVKKADKPELDRLTPPSSVHQGILLETSPLHEPSLSDIIAGNTPPELIIVLDQVTDPHNVGAILRSAAAFGAGAVIMTERNAPSTTGVMAKTASGAVEHVPQIHVVNLARALDELQEAGYWRVGLAEEGNKNMDELDLSGRTVLVLGAEGDGLRQLTRKKCDELARLPTGGAIGSLNVSNAAAVALYEVRRQKKSFK